MSEVDTQNIPAGLLYLYEGALGPARSWKEMTTVQKRSPFRIGWMQGAGIYGVDGFLMGGCTIAQQYVRKLFARACFYFNLQKDSGGAEPPAIGYRNKSWWYTASQGSGMYYYNYFIQQTLIAFFAGIFPDWCKEALYSASTVRSSSPDGPWNNTQYLAIDKHTGPPLLEWWTYIKTPVTGPYIYLYFGGCGEDYCDVIDHTLEYYETSNAWNPNTLTWNNKPPDGNKIGEETLYGITKWVALKIPATPAIVIKHLSPIDFLYTMEHVTNNDPTVRPYATALPP